MYSRVLLPVDNSPHSQAAAELAAHLASRVGAEVVGLHVYAAQLHDARFRQLEDGLPPRYQQPEALSRQRAAHDTLIARGLELISRSYLDQAEKVCCSREVPFRGKTAEGKNCEAVLRELEQGGYDLVALGALGLGAGPRSQMGSVCLRVLRGARCDVLVVRPGEGGRRVVVAIDGSPNSWRALEQALGVGRALGLGVEVVAAFDPLFHRVAFQALAGVLSDEAGRLFRFKEQEKLHEQVIDQGLMKLYQGYLAHASHLAEQQGQRVSTRLLEGKAWAAILSLLEADPPQMLVVGRYGSHRNGHDIGSTTEELARQAPCSVLVTTGESSSSLSEPEAAQAPGQVEWTAEAEARLDRVPFFARGMARKAIEDYARENGITQITPEVMARAREHRGL